MAQTEMSVRWGVEQRLEFIEFRLFWEGGINRSDIMNSFGVSVPQASNDLGQYQAFAPSNVVYDRSHKRYLPAGDFSPRFLSPDPDRYLSQLRAVADGSLAPADSWIGTIPSHDVVRLPHRNVDPTVLRSLLAAVRGRKAVEVCYQSLSPGRPSANWRWLSPHSFVFDGHRWHVRAFCHADKEFADFLLPRFLKIRHTADALAGPDADSVWNESTTVILKPHPRLNVDQRKVVAHDYGMKDERLTVQTRLALLYYFLKRMNLDFEEEKRPPHEQHVVLANAAEVGRALERARLT